MKLVLPAFESNLAQPAQSKECDLLRDYLVKAILGWAMAVAVW